jgi:hypothetical protein
MNAVSKFFADLLAWPACSAVFLDLCTMVCNIMHHLECSVSTSDPFLISARCVHSLRFLIPVWQGALIISARSICSGLCHVDIAMVSSIKTLLSTLFDNVGV